MESKGYLDFHTHILPGIDDGSTNMDVTRKMLQMEYQQGVRTILATSHNYPDNAPQDNDKVRALCAKVDEEAQKIDPAFRVLPGNEVLYRESILTELEEGHILTLADSRYILVEFVPGEKFRRINDGVRAIVEEGYYPVIAHVERVECLMNDTGKVKELVDMGSYMQANCEDFLGGFFNKQAKQLRKMMEENLIHFLGSDCHNTSTRPPMMEDCVQFLCKKISKKNAEKVIYDNPSRFLQKKYI